MMKWLRQFDLEYWQMREALGYPIPNWVDRRWPRKFQGNAGVNPHKCGMCDARQKYPHLHGMKASADGVAVILEDALRVENGRIEGVGYAAVKIATAVETGKYTD